MVFGLHLQIFRFQAPAWEYIFEAPAYFLPNAKYLLNRSSNTIALHLKHESEVEAYLQQRRQQSQEIRAMNQAKFDPQGLRDRLLARRTAQEPC